VFLCVILLYWLSVIIGALDMSSFDFDMDVDIDVDVDADVDAGSSGGGWFAGGLHFFNFGRLSFTVVFSLLILGMWSMSILGNFYLGNGSMVFPFIMFIPILFVSLVMTKIITTPLVPVFESLDKGVEAVDYLGLTCKMLLPATTTQMVQAEVLHNSNPLLVSVMVSETQKTAVLKGEEALIVGRSSDDRYFLIEKI
jgi:hypothetical protein